MDFLSNTWKAVQNVCSPLGNFASVAGLLVSLVGFYLTIKNVTTAKRAARSAELAANSAKQSILRSGAIAKFSGAIGLMEDIKRLQRKKDWSTVLDRCAELRRVLVELQNEATELAESERAILGGVMSQIDLIEARVEKAFADEKAAPNVVKISTILSEQIVKVHELSTKLRIK